jgi:AcrR family transcriptional regulator
MKKRASPLPAAERRALCVQTVLQLAFERNPAEITTGAVAARMGICQAALFRHFPTKDALWEEVMQWATGELYAALEAAAAKNDAPPNALERIYHTHLTFITGNPGVPRILFVELQNPAGSRAREIAREMLSRYARLLEELIASGIESGFFDESIDTRAAATMFIGMIQGQVMQAMIDDACPLNRQSEKLFGLFLRAIEKRTLH